MLDRRGPRGAHWILAGFVVALSCSCRHAVQLPLDHATRVQIQAAASGKDFYYELKKPNPGFPDTGTGSLLQLEPSRASWIPAQADPDDGAAARVQVPEEALRRIDVVCCRVRVAIMTSLVAPFATGLMATAAQASAVENCKRRGEWLCGLGEGMNTIVATGGALVLGAVLGAMVGQPETWIFRPAEGAPPKPP